jgi:hypothetical protein
MLRASTWCLSAGSVGITLLKLDPTAQIPWTNTMLGLLSLDFILFSLFSSSAYYRNLHSLM